MSTRSWDNHATPLLTKHGKIYLAPDGCRGLLCRTSVSTAWRSGLRPVRPYASGISNACTIDVHARRCCARDLLSNIPQTCLIFVFYPALLT